MATQLDFAARAMPSLAAARTREILAQIVQADTEAQAAHQRVRCASEQRAWPSRAMSVC